MEQQGCLLGQEDLEGESEPLQTATSIGGLQSASASEAMVLATLPPQMPDPVAMLFAPMASIEERFPGLKGVVLQQRVWQLYVVRTGAHLEFFTNGRPTMGPPLS